MKPSDVTHARFAGSLWYPKFEMLKGLLDRQLSFLFGHSEDSLRRHIEASLDRPVSLILTDNSASMLSARIANELMCVRLHRMFLHADDAVIDEIVSALRKRKSEMPNFRRFIRDNREALRKRLPQKIIARPLGRYYDLRELFDEINAEYFAGTVRSVITWGNSSPRGAVRKRTLGSYSRGNDLIRINPVLDRRNVPRYFLAFVVYHEMLHAVIGTEIKGGRRVVHSKEFKKRERLFRHYERALAWERQSAA
ncbi:MAG TPA: SprT-like domain-containing protein [Dissulfurispiraceae bacterium]|nr:SprT-like domain-containing protein [Dissulfurispiraceae bacterium]